MKITNIPIKDCKPSPTNPRAKIDPKSPGFKDLVSSVKEKGIIVPVIVRTILDSISKTKAGLETDHHYEVVAGNRRLAAAKEAGLKEIPAEIREMTDQEAQEIQIIENLQREDVHPLEEGTAYRKLVDEGKQEVASVAAKVGKSETYVRQRMFLTNLIVTAQDAYRSDKIKDGHAVLIAHLTGEDQMKALKYALNHWGGLLSLKDLKEYIETEFNKPLEMQPWLKDQDAAKVVGKCVECPPNIPSLFGAVKEGACTNKKCWTRKMMKYITYRKANDPKLVLISKESNYNRNSKDGDILFDNQYTTVGPSNKCQHSVVGLVAKGRGIGSQIRICISKDCKKHATRNGRSSAALTPAEKEKRAKQEAAEKLAEQKAAKKKAEAMADALKKVKWPLSRKTLDVLFELAFEGDNQLDEIGERRWPDTQVPKGEQYVDWDAVIRKAAEKMSDQEKLQLLTEIMLSTVWYDKQARYIKAL